MLRESDHFRLVVLGIGQNLTALQLVVPVLASEAVVYREVSSRLGVPLQLLRLHMIKLKNLLGKSRKLLGK